MKSNKIIFILFVGLILMFSACSNKKSSSTAEKPQPVGPAFQADSAFLFCQQQCDFGPRTMNSETHERCAQWIADKFRQYGMEITLQKANLKGYDGTILKSTNIIASYRPELKERILLCAHWDSRPWADNDPDEANWKKPVIAANDGASGVAVMIEVARLLQQASSAKTDSTANKQSSEMNAEIGVDFICFDAEDWGIPQWEEKSADDSWALGAQYWAAHLHQPDYRARYGILLDMVGGQGAQFYQELYSIKYASNLVDRVWQAASVVGYSSYFPYKEGGMITDDHVPVNQVAGIPCIDIIPCYPDCEQSSFGPTWHTINDDMQHIDRNTLKAVGQTVIQVLFSE